MNTETSESRTETLLGTRNRLYSASESGGRATIIKDDGRKKIVVGFNQGETIEGVEMTQEGLRAKLCSH